MYLLQKMFSNECKVWTELILLVDTPDFHYHEFVRKKLKDDDREEMNEIYPKKKDR